MYVYHTSLTAVRLECECDIGFPANDLALLGGGGTAVINGGIKMIHSRR